MTPAILWFRRDLRTRDNPALLAAAEGGRPIIPVYVVDDLDQGGASRWWLHHSLESLDRSLRPHGSRPVFRNGRPADVLGEIVARTGASDVYFNRRFEPAARRQEADVEQAIAGTCGIHAFDGALLRYPDEPRTLSGKPFKVFTPYWKAATAMGDPDRPGPAPAKLITMDGGLESPDIHELGLLPSKPDWAGGLRATWTPGESGALERLDSAVDIAGSYAELRDRPDREATSRLSPHLHFGELSPRQVWHDVASGNTRSGKTGADALLRQLFWREFSTYLLFHFPSLPDTPLRKEFEDFPWVDDRVGFHAWQRGLTGYPIVDAGMRQLWHTGWMHNRVRMIAASFLVKDLLVPWQDGADWFLDTLVDADLANNSASWQWVAGCGTDAAPYFRIFNPVLQGQKFDPLGDYVRRWVPELERLPARYIHEPWTAPLDEQKAANMVIGEDYPEPIVNHREARDLALTAYRAIRKQDSDRLAKKR